MTRSKISSFLVFAAGWTLLSGLTPVAVWGAIGGTITGATATRTGCFDASCPETATSTTQNVSFITSSAVMTNSMGAAAFNAYNFVYAQNYPGGALPNIPDSDFTIAQYAPWVVDNNNTTNFVSGPDQSGGNNVKHSRNLTGEDAGGANIVINYTPRANSTDPTDINFLQAYQLNMNGAGFNAGTMDNGGAADPTYNGSGGVSGTGTTNRSGTSPLTTSSVLAGWMVDIPYTPEKGYGPVFADDTINSETDNFVAFITGTKFNAGDGKTYNVLYGGVSWGYTFTTVDTPEPATLMLLLPATLFAFARRQRRTA
jgi:hypothetical protein